MTSIFAQAQRDFAEAHAVRVSVGELLDRAAAGDMRWAFRLEERTAADMSGSLS